MPAKKISHAGSTGKLSELDYRTIKVRLDDNYTEGGYALDAATYGFASIVALVPLSSALPVSYDPVAGTFTLYGIGAKGVDTAATLETVLAGTQNDLVFTALRSNQAGNLINVAYVDPAANNAALSVSVDDGYAITVSLATNGGGTITSTAALVKAALDAHVDASGLISTANATLNDGTGVVTAMAAEFLTGGASTGAPVQTADASVIHEGVELHFLAIGIKA